MDFDRAARINELHNISADICSIAEMLENISPGENNASVILSMMRSSVALLQETSNAMHDELLPENIPYKG